MSRIRQGWELTKKSWGILRAHRSLIRFPLYGGIAMILFTILILGPGFYLIEDGQISPGAPLVVIGLYLLSFTGFFFNVGLAACADLAFRGQEPTVGDGMSVARSRIPQIATWAAIATTVGIILNTLENQGGIFGAIAGRLLAVGWSLITFLAVPVIAFEGTGGFGTLKRSTALFRERWGQQITGNVAIGGAVALIGILPAILLIAVGVVVWSSSGFAGAVLIGFGVIIFAVAALISQALSGIFGVALYHYATAGQPAGGFTVEEMDRAVKRRKGATGGPSPAPA